MEKIKFIEETHEYFLGDKKLISVTQLLKKHGISADYSGVNEEILNAASARGNVIHKEIENFVIKNEIGFTEELEAFIDLCEENNIKPTNAEFIVHNDTIGGKVDLEAIIEDNVKALFDIKTTSVLHKNSLAWQLSLYNYLAGGIYEKLGCFHFTSNSKKLIEVPFIPNAEIEKLLNCEINGEIYKQEFEIEETTQNQIIALQNVLDTLKKQEEKAKAELAEITNFIKNKMKENAISKIDNEFFTITYKAPYTRESIDNTRLKKELPEVAKTYTKISDVRDSIIIKIKGGENE